MRARNAGRSRAYCSSVISSEAASLRTALDPVSDAQQLQRVGRRAFASEATFNLMTGHGAVAGVIVGAGTLHALEHRATDLHRGVTKFALYGVGTVVTGTTLDHFDRGIRHQSQHIAGLEPDILHAQVTRHVIADPAEPAAEIRAQQAGLVPEHEVFERIEYVLGDALYLRIVAEHQRQLLLEHEHARRDGSHHVVAGINQPEQL